MSKLKKIPELKAEADEREFWGNHDSTDYVIGPKLGRSSCPD